MGCGLGFGPGVRAHLWASRRSPHFDIDLLIAEHALRELTQHCPTWKDKSTAQRGPSTISMKGVRFLPSEVYGEIVRVEVDVVVGNVDAVNRDVHLKRSKAEAIAL